MKPKGPKPEDIQSTPIRVYRAIVLGDSSHAVFRGEGREPKEAGLFIFCHYEEGDEAINLITLDEIKVLHDFLGECLDRLRSGMN